MLMEQQNKKRLLEARIYQNSSEQGRGREVGVTGDTDEVSLAGKSCQYNIFIFTEGVSHRLIILTRRAQEKQLVLIQKDVAIVLGVPQTREAHISPFHATTRLQSLEWSMPTF